MTAIDAQHDDAGGAVHPRPDPQHRGAARARTTPPTRASDLPAIPEAFHRTLDDGLAGLGLELDEAVRRRLTDHARLLLAWTTAINLTAIRDPEAVARLHVLDSLSAVPLLRERGVERFVDLGSGGG
jgi:hypothetical protein